MRSSAVGRGSDYVCGVDNISMNNQQPTYKIEYSLDDACYVATSSKYRLLSGLDETADGALNELIIAVSAAKEVEKESEILRKETTFRALLSGDHECFCFAVPPEDCFSPASGFEWKSLHTNWFHENMMSVYMDDLLPELPDEHYGKMYRFKITIEAEPVNT
jgi:hypothetical protein